MAVVELYRHLCRFSHVHERVKGLLRGILAGGVGNGCFLGHVRKEVIP